MEATQIDMEAVRKSYAGKFCPILSIASLGKPESKIVTAEGPADKPSATACQGQSCMFFKLVANEKGEVVAGECAISLMVSALTAGQNAIAQGQLAMMGAFAQLVQPKPQPFKNVRK